MSILNEILTHIYITREYCTEDASEFVNVHIRERERPSILFQ